MLRRRHGHGHGWSVLALGQPEKGAPAGKARHALGLRLRRGAPCAEEEEALGGGRLFRRGALPKKSRWMARSARSIGVSAPASSSGSSAPLAKCPSAGGPGGAGGAAGAAPSEAAGAAEAAAAEAAEEAAALAEETYSLSREADDTK